MPSPQRRFDPPVIEQLREEPFRFGFFQAVRLVELSMLRRRERDAQRRWDRFGRLDGGADDGAEAPFEGGAVQALGG